MTAQQFDILANQIATKELMSLQAHLAKDSLLILEPQEKAIAIALTKVARLAMSNVAMLQTTGHDISTAEKL